MKKVNDGDESDEDEAGLDGKGGGGDEVRTLTNYLPRSVATLSMQLYSSGHE